MNKHKFIEYLRKPENFDENSLRDLLKIAATYPYFQSARTLLAKAAKIKKVKNANKFVGNAAIYATDRAMLKKYLSDDLFFLKPLSAHESHEADHERDLSEEIQTVKSTTIQNKLKSTPPPQIPSGKTITNVEVQDDPPAQKDTVSPPGEAAPPRRSSGNSDLDAIIDELYADMAKLKANREKFKEYEDKFEEEDAVNKALKKVSKKSDTTKKKEIAEPAEEKPPVDEVQETAAIEEETTETTTEQNEPEEETVNETDAPENEVKIKEEESKTEVAEEEVVEEKEEETEKEVVEKKEKIAEKKKEEAVEKKQAEPKEKASASVQKKAPKKEKPIAKKEEPVDEDPPAVRKKTITVKKVTSSKAKKAEDKEKKKEAPATEASKSRSARGNRPSPAEPSSDIPKKKTIELSKVKVIRKTTLKKKADKGSGPSEKPVTQKKAAAKKKTDDKKDDPDQASQEKIISDFIKVNPSISPADGTVRSDEDLSKGSTELDPEIASEYLANIYLQQGKKDRAVEIYQTLMLKFPQKKSYFADLIEKLK